MASTPMQGGPRANASAAPEGSGVIPIVVAAACGAEVVLVFGHLGVGVLLEAIVLAAILTLQARWDSPHVRAMAPIALVPLLRLLSLTTPLPGLPTVFWLALAGIPLAIGGVMAARAAGLTLDALGLRRTPSVPQVSIALLGVPAGYALWRLVGATSLIDLGQTPGELLVTALLLVVFAGFVEEFIFRGVIQSALSATYGGGAVPLAGILYGSSYLGSLSLEYTGFMTVVGIVYGLIAWRSGSILGISASHAILILSATFLFPAL